MNISPPIPWHLVPVGAVVLDHDTPRTVLGNDPLEYGELLYFRLSPAESWRAVLLEGMAPLIARADITTNLVTLDDTDAAAVLAAAGLTVKEISP